MSLRVRLQHGQLFVAVENQMIVFRAQGEGRVSKRLRQSPSLRILMNKVFPSIAIKIILTRLTDIAKEPRHSQSPMKRRRWHSVDAI